MRGGRLYADVSFDDGVYEGWTKNLAILFGNPLFLAANRLLDFFLLLGLPVLLFVWPHLVSWQMVAIVLLWLRVLLRYYNRISRSNFPLVDWVICLCIAFVLFVVATEFGRR